MFYVNNNKIKYNTGIKISFPILIENQERSLFHYQ